ncbi:MAG: hypothetical protein U0935_18365 [Pirellulales bacterium]
MDSQVFENRLAAWFAKSAPGTCRFQPRSMAVIWRRPFGMPFDRLMTELVTLYLEADDTQRLRLAEQTAEHRRVLGDASHFICRLLSCIRTPADTQWVRLALAVTRLDVDRTDYRDLIVSLVLVRHVAAHRGFDIVPLIDEELATASGTLREILLNVRQHSERDILAAAQGWQLPAWDAPFFRDEADYVEPSWWRRLWTWWT